MFASLIDLYVLYLTHMTYMILVGWFLEPICIYYFRVNKLCYFSLAQQQPRTKQNKLLMSYALRCK